MIYVCRESYINNITKAEFLGALERMIIDALIQADLGAKDVQLRFSDNVLFRYSMRILFTEAKRLGFQCYPKNEIEYTIYNAYNEKVSYAFFNSISLEDTGDDIIINFNEFIKNPEDKE
jgi:hypothetical protein